MIPLRPAYTLAIRRRGGWRAVSMTARRGGIDDGGDAAGLRIECVLDRAHKASLQARPRRGPGRYCMMSIGPRTAHPRGFRHPCPIMGRRRDSSTIRPCISARTDPSEVFQFVTAAPAQTERRGLVGQASTRRPSFLARCGPAHARHRCTVRACCPFASRRPDPAPGLRRRSQHHFVAGGRARAWRSVHAPDPRIHAGRRRS